MPYLPHIYPPGATFFITFRLADSLPQHTVRQLREELEAELRSIRKADLPPHVKDFKIYQKRKDLFGKYDHQLDAKPYGDCVLKDSTVAKILYDKILLYDGVHYTLHALSIMPNHVHLLADTSIQIPADAVEVPTGYVDVNKWMQLIKGGSAFLINQHLGRSGTLWAK